MRDAPAGQSTVDSMKVMARPSGESCGSPTRGMLRRSTSVIGRFSAWVMTLDVNARHADTRNATNTSRRSGIEFERV
jgi:hypothetical protein